MIVYVGPKYKHLTINKSYRLKGIKFNNFELKLTILNDSGFKDDVLLKNFKFNIWRFL